MSTEQKKHEKECFVKAVELGYRRGGETKRIMQRLNGTELERSKPERPDFIKACPLKSKADKGTLIGIEHFCVDLFSERMKKGDDITINSLGAKNRSSIRKVMNDWSEIVKKEDSLPEGAIIALGDILAESMEARKKSDYSSLLESFACSFTKHLKKVPEYRGEIKRHFSPGQNIEIAFLIEVHYDFGNLFLGDSDTVRCYEPWEFLLFEEIVQILETAKSKVDYIVLLAGPTVYGNEINCLALSCRNLRKSISKQNVKIYTYVGEDRVISRIQHLEKAAKVTPSISRKNEQIEILLDTEWTDVVPEQKVEAIYQGYELACEVMGNGDSYAATSGVHMLIELNKEPISSKPKTWGEYLTWFDDFEKKWHKQPEVEEPKLYIAAE